MTVEEATRCERCQSPLESGDIRCPICGMSAPEIRPVDGARVRVEILRCEGCGAATTYDAKHQAPRCAFCGSVTHLEALEDPPEQVEAYLPFEVDSSAARAALRRWLGSLGWFRPSNLMAEATVEDLMSLWWVGWVFDAQAVVSWTGDSDHGTERSSWAPHAGQTHVDFDGILVSASKGLSQEETRALTPSYDLDSARPEALGPPEAVAERFDVQRSLARQQVLAAVNATAHHVAENEELPGKSKRKVHAVALLRGLATRRLAFPAHVLAYRYGDRLYRAVISGQGEAFVLGTAPYSTWKILGAVAGGLAALALLAWAAAS